ncbi:PQQ-binding-like beta-propeller repeat protein [Candidatus Bathyarchaeota archaeon]|nr:PQQ-binding-like beta-propeller repeat protein [Candidatus Bathyarchaeota archaeon]
MKRTLSIIISIMLLASMLAFSFNTQNIKASGTIYVKADGSIDPPTALMQRDGDLRPQSTIDWWPMFRHDPRHTGYSISNVTEPIDVSKKFTTGGKVISSPAVVDDIVFVGSLDGYVYAWNATPPYATQWKSDKIGAIYSSPTVVEQVVYVGSADKNIYALNATNGAEIWHNATGGEVKSSPVVGEGVLYVGSSDGYFYALNASTGSELWRYRTASPIESSPAIFGDTIVFGTNDGRVYSLNKTGRYEWHFQTNGPVASSPAFADGIIFVGSNDTKVYAINATSGAEIWNYTVEGTATASPAIAYDRVFVGSDDGYLYALNATSSHLGEGERLKWKIATDGPITSSPAVSGDGKVFVGSCDNRTCAFDVFTGNQIWNYSTGGAVTSSPAIANGKVFVGSHDELVYDFGTRNKLPVAIIKHYPDNPVIYHNATFNASDSYDPDGYIETYSWDFGDNSTGKGMNVTHSYSNAETYTVTLTVTDNSGDYNSTSQLITVLEAWLMFHHDPTRGGYSTSLAPVTNQTLWIKTIGPEVGADDSMYPSPAIVNDVVYIGSTNGTVYALDAIDGSVIWNSTPGGKIRSSPAVADGLVFIGSDDPNVYALNASDGHLIWKYTAGGQFLSSPAVAYGKVFITSRDGWLHALPETDPDGDGIIQLNEVKWRYRHSEGGEVYSSPAVADGMVFFGSLDKNIYALLDDPNSNGTIDPNEVKWFKSTNGSIYSSPAVAYGKVFVSSDDGYVYAFNITNGNIIWKHKVGDHIRSSPAVANGLVFIGSDDGNLYALNATSNNPDGEEIWKQPIGSVRWSSPAVAENKVFIGTMDGKIYSLRVKDGKIWWCYTLQTHGPVDSSPAVLDDKLYVGSKDGNFYAFWEQVHDIAIARAEPSKTKVVQNETVYIAVSVENQGSFNETNINVTAQYDDKLFYNTSISLTRGEEQTLQIPWNTTGVDIGNYTICVNATLAPHLTDNDPADNTKCFDIAVELGVHDIKVTDVRPGKTVVGQGYNATINVTVVNEGNFTEYDISVTAYWYNGTHINQTIGSTTIPELRINASIIVNITWNTTGFAYGNYTVWAYAWPVEGETETADNTFVDVWVIVTIPGDVDGDFDVDIYDVVAICVAYGSKIGEPAYVPECDINCDGKIDIYDVVIACTHYGQKYP